MNRSDLYSSDFKALRIGDVLELEAEYQGVLMTVTLLVSFPKHVFEEYLLMTSALGKITGDTKRKPDSGAFFVEAPHLSVPSALGCAGPLEIKAHLEVFRGGISL